jgi:hypothetical protein
VRATGTNTARECALSAGLSLRDLPTAFRMKVYANKSLISMHSWSLQAYLGILDESAVSLIAVILLD